MSAGTSRRPEVPRITTAALVADPLVGVGLTALAASEHAGDRAITHPRVQKTGLALVGHGYGVVPTRVQILGETELSFLATLSEDRVREAMGFFYGLGLACVIVTGNNRPRAAIVEEAEKLGVPLYLSEARSSRTINALHAVLDERLAPRASMHGVLVDIFTVGVLILGKSGIGKSECALELIMRGHRLVADDLVHCDWRPPGMVFGVPDPRLAHHLEIRGLGILDVKEIFGITATRERIERTRQATLAAEESARAERRLERIAAEQVALANTATRVANRRSRDAATRAGLRTAATLVAGVVLAVAAMQWLNLDARMAAPAPAGTASVMPVVTPSPIEANVPATNAEPLSLKLAAGLASASN